MFKTFTDQPEYAESLSELVRVTEGLVRNHVEESLWIVAATAQRANADTKVRSCIELVTILSHSKVDRLFVRVGMKSAPVFGSI